MYETFEAARNGALDVVERLYSGDKMDCVVVEMRRGSHTWFNFRFHSTDTNGEWIKLEYNVFERRFRI